MSSRRVYSPVEALVVWFAFILICAVGLLAIVAHAALAASPDDGFVRRLEFLFHVERGGYVPVSPQAPDIRLQYLGTREVGRDTYDVRVHRVR